MMFPYTRTTFHSGLFVMRQANIVDLIARAYAVDPGNILGGPSWLESGRFDIFARTPPHTSPQIANQMLRTLLADRFHLVVHTSSKPQPAYVLTVAKGGPTLTESDGSADSDCRYIDPPSNLPATTVPLYTFSCHNIAMETFAQDLHAWAGDYLDHPVVDATGLAGAWDFDIKFHSKGRYARAGADGISIFDAVDKQLGLKLEAKTAPTPVLIVDRADQTPTPNPANVAELLPPPPPPEFEVATVRPSSPGEKPAPGRIDGGQASLQAGTLQMMITYAWDITDEMLVGAPKWVATDHFDIVAKAASNPEDSGPGAPPIYPDDLRQMVRKLLEARFNLVAHQEQRPIDAYTLIAANPRLRQADPAGRTGCKEGPGDDAKDPRLTNPSLDRLVTCRNVTIAQFAAQLITIANGYIRIPVLDATGIAGAYDFTLSFSSAARLGNATAAVSSSAASSQEAPSAPDPGGGVSLADAINKTLGLKLIQQKRPVPVLVIDHIQEKPTEN
jgi:uncharacterized protein (TIGR03435 family)